MAEDEEAETLTLGEPFLAGEKDLHADCSACNHDAPFSSFFEGPRFSSASVYRCIGVL
jgi:hypothetical protein